MPEIEAKPVSKSLGGYVALGVLAVCFGACVWVALHPGKADPVLSYGMIAIGTGGGLTALIAYIRDMSFWAVAKIGFDWFVTLFDALSTIVSLFSW